MGRVSRASNGEQRGQKVRYRGADLVLSGGDTGGESNGDAEGGYECAARERTKLLGGCCKNRGNRLGKVGFKV